MRFLERSPNERREMMDQMMKKMEHER